MDVFYDNDVVFQKSYRILLANQQLPSIYFYIKPLYQGINYSDDQLEIFTSMFSDQQTWLDTYDLFNSPIQTYWSLEYTINYSENLNYVPKHFNPFSVSVLYIATSLIVIGRIRLVLTELQKCAEPVSELC